MRDPLVLYLIAAALLFSTVIEAQTVPADFDFKAAESRLEWSDDFGGTKLAKPTRKNLHEAERATDGRRGYAVGAPLIRRVEPPHPPPPPPRP